MVVEGLLVPGLRFVDREMDAAVPLTRLTEPDGRVRTLVERGERSFGFITREQGEDCYFNPQLLGKDVEMADLTVGSLVTFDVTSGHKGNPQARGVSPWNPRGDSVGVRRAGQRVRLERKTVVGAGPSAAWEVEFTFAGKPVQGRGLPIVAERVGRARGSWRGFADASGLTEFREWATTQFGTRPGHRAVPVAEQSADEEVVGLDLVGDTWLATDSGQAQTVASTARTSRVGLEGGDHEWLVTAPGVLWAPEHPEAQHWSLERVLFEPPSEPGERVIGVDRIVSSLADRLTRPHHGVAWTVPDDLQDLDQKALRTNMALRFGRALPVWRSVAAATSWLHNTSHSPREGDNLLVLDAGGYRLSAVFLVARMDKRLQRDRKQSQGIYWERRPPLPGGDDSEELGEAAFLRAYARHLANRATAGTSISQRGRDQLRVWLSNSGLAEALTGEDCSEIVQIEGHGLLLARDAKALGRAAQDWTKALGAAAQEWGAESTLADLIKKPPGQGRLRVLVVGRPFTVWGDQQALRAALAPLLGDVAIDAIDVARGELALGAHEAMERSRLGLIAWRDWLPDLYLEVVRDGLYDELTLVEGRQVDAALGQQTRIDVDEALVLPAGLSSYAFPLETGRENRRPTGRNIELRSRTFPLDTDVPVELTLRYRYGLADAWELEVSPRGAERPFGVLKAAWGDSRSSEPLPGGGPIPPFAQHASGAPRSKGLSALEDFCGWFEWKVDESDWDDLEWCDYLARRLKKMRWALYAVHDSASWERLKTRPSVLKLLQQLFRLAGTTTAFGADPLEMRFKEHRLLREEATILLSCLGQFAPAGFRAILGNRIRSVLSHPERLGNRAVAAVDAAGRQLTVAADPELEAVIWGALSRVRTWQSPRLHLRAMSAWARIAWRREEFVGAFASANPEGPQHLFSTVERQLDHLTLQVAKERSIAEARRGYFLFPFQTYCEVLLALLRLRGRTMVRTSVLEALGSTRWPGRCAASTAC